MYYGRGKIISLCIYFDNDSLLSRSLHKHHPMWSSQHPPSPCVNPQCTGPAAVWIPCPRAHFTSTRLGLSVDNKVSVRYHWINARFNGHLVDDTHRTQHTAMPSLWSTVTMQKQQREKAHGAKSRRSQAYISRGPFPVESHMIHLISPAMSYGNICKMLSAQKAHPSIGVQGFYWGSVM